MGILQKKCCTTAKKGPGVQGKSWPKYRYCFSCLKVRGGSLPSKCFNVSSSVRIFLGNFYPQKVILFPEVILKIPLEMHCHKS